MTTIQQLAEQKDWHINIEFDPNVRGDGSIICFGGDTKAFRNFAAIFTAMADAVDNPDHPSSQTGWSLVFNSDSFPQFKIENFARLSLCCLPAGKD